MQLEVTIASDSSAARGICTRTGSGRCDNRSIRELWIQEAYRTKALACLTLMDQEHRASHGGDGEGRDG